MIAEMKRVKKWRIEKISTLSAILILLIGIVFFYSDVGILGNFILIAVMVAFVPRALISFFSYQRIKMMEDTFPILLQDLAEWLKSGLTLQDALRNASNVDYGRLNQEIKKMSIQLSWGIPLQEVLKRFGERMKSSPVIRKATEIIIESYNTGGNIEETIDAIAEDIFLIKEMEKERKAVMFQHVVTIYIIYFVFLGIIVGVSNMLLPMKGISTEIGGVTLGFLDPCIPCQGKFHPFCISCITFKGISQIFLLGTGAEGYYRGLFFSMLLIQGIFSGLICGEISENSLSAGTRHSLVMTLVGLGIFMILVRLGVI